MILPDNKCGDRFSPLLIRIGLTMGLCLWLGLFIGGVVTFPGSRLNYIIFSVIFIVLLGSGFYRQIAYGYFFLTIFLWLGFWFKLTVHSIFRYQFVEPVGDFVGNVANWNDVLQVSTVAAIGVITARILYSVAGGGATIAGEIQARKVPAWYLPFRRPLWTLMLICILGLAVFNAVFGIHQIGLIPRTVLFWPLNAVISWLLNIGMAIGISMMIWWEASLGKEISVSIYSILIEGYVTSVSVLSRGAFIYHAIPQIFSVFKQRVIFKKLSPFNIVLIGVVFISLFVVSQSAVNTLRSYLYQSGYEFSSKIQMKKTRIEVIDGEIARLKGSISKNNWMLAKVPEPKAAMELKREIIHLEGRLRSLLEEKHQLEASLADEQKRWQQLSGTWSGEAQMLVDEFVYQLGGGIYSQLARLTSDRWIGLEGVMAVQSFSHKNLEMLWNGLTEKRSNGKVTFYQNICKSHYRTVSDSFQFGSLPGAAAFLYYSGSLWVVVMGMVVFTVIILALEGVVGRLCGNPILCSLVGFSLANTVAQFGVTPRQDIPYYIMIFGSVLVIWYAQSPSFNKMLHILRILPRRP